MNDPEKFFDDLGARREAEMASMDRRIYEPAIRNHLVQLFRKAHADDPELTGVLFGMGGFSIQGNYITAGDPTSEFPEEREQVFHPCNDWVPRIYDSHQPRSEATRLFFKTMEAYSQHAGTREDPLPLIDVDITLNDLESRSSKKAKVWRSR